jgi:hypothetical protein
MTQFEALADAGKNNRVIADDITAANRMNS